MSCRRIRKLQPPPPSASFSLRVTCSPEMKVISTPPRMSVKVVSKGWHSRSYALGACPWTSSVVITLSPAEPTRRTPCHLVHGIEDGGRGKAVFISKIFHGDQSRHIISHGSLGPVRR